MGESHHSVGGFPHSVWGELPPHCEGFPSHYTSQCDVQCDTLTWSVPLGWYLRPSYRYRYCTAVKHTTRTLSGVCDFSTFMVARRGGGGPLLVNF